MMKRVRFQQKETTTTTAAVAGPWTPRKNTADPFDEIQNKETKVTKTKSETPSRKSKIIPGVVYHHRKNKANGNKFLLSPVLRAPSDKHYSPEIGLFQCQIFVKANCYFLVYHRQGSKSIPLLRADKQLTLKVLPKYYIYDIFGGMQGGGSGNKAVLPLTKESEEYIGKIRRDKDCTIHAFSLHPKRDTVRSQQSLYVLYDDVDDDNGVACCHRQPNAPPTSPPPPTTRPTVPRSVQVALYNQQDDSRLHMNTLADKVSSSLKEEGLSKSLTHVAEPISGLYVFANKEPYKNKAGQWTLNFHHRCRRASPANIQLQDDDNDGKIILQLAQWENDRFNLDFRAPFNAFQAFGFAIAQLCDY